MALIRGGFAQGVDGRLVRREIAVDHLYDSWLDFRVAGVVERREGLDGAPFVGWRQLEEFEGTIVGDRPVFLVGDVRVVCVED